MKKIYYCLFLMLTLVLTGYQGFGQSTTTAALNGTITDEKGEPLPGTTVVAIHTPTNTQYVASTNQDGRFNIQNMRVGGPYTVKTTFIGYQDQVRENVFLRLGESTRIDLKVSEATTTLGEVQVTSQRDNVINAERNGAATNVTREQIERLPTISRSFQDFTRLTPQANGNSLLGRNGRFNNIQIDGASNNDLFGLGSSGAPGGQAGTTPISLDAIEEFQVVLSPYDVRQGRFSGGGINAITRSGTNTFGGSAFFFGRNENTAGKSPTPNADGVRTKLDEFSDYQTGFRLGGPILKNKLFFFVNGEVTRRSEPLLFRAGEPGETGSDVVEFVNSDQLAQIDQVLREKYGYDPGSFGNINRETESNKFFARLDWNITDKHQLTLRHNFVDAFQDQITRGKTEFRFGNNGYRFTDKTNSSVLELKSRFNDRYSNNLLIGYSTIRDARAIKGSLFPSVTIGFGNGNVVAGSERSSTQNTLDQNVLEITDNFNYFAGNHTFTFGTSNEIFRFDNLFINDAAGRYDFPTFADFLAGSSTNSNYRYRQQYVIGKRSAKFGAAQFGLYVQDEYNVSESLRITGGLRADMAVYLDKPSYNPKVEELFGLRTDKLPDSKIQLSPRLGFNWDVKNDQKTQVRGGVGLFTGRPAYVWISNQYGGTGMDIASIDLRGNSTPTPAPALSADIASTFATGTGTPPKSSIAITSPDFKNPQLLRANLAADQVLGGGFTLTLEGIFSKTRNDVLPVDLNLVEPTTTLPGDGRPVFPTNRNVSTEFFNVIQLQNTSKGYQYSLTAELKKQFTKNLFANVAYTYGQARDLYSGTSSTAVSTWEFNPHVLGPNNLTLSYSNFDLRNRVIASASYRKEYINHLATTISFFYNGQNGPAYSYTYYGGDINNDGGQNTSNSNDLIYIPRDRNDIVLTTAGTSDPRSLDQIWDELNTFIENDKYLSEHRGQYAARNGARAPFQHRVDMRLMQDIFTNLGGRNHTLQLTVDVTNIGNLLNKDWGRDYFILNDNFGLLRYQGTEGPGGRPTFTFGDGVNPSPKEGFQVSQLSSRWQAQFGIRYIF
jgi:outer membrane receptor protein involved in Fe transport